MDKKITVSVKVSQELLDGSIGIKEIIEADLSRRLHNYLLSENKRIEKLILEGDPSKDKPVGVIKRAVEHGEIVTPDKFFIG